jgi:hypothetical protein
VDSNDVHELFLAAEEDGEVPRTPGDYEVRGGLTGRPLTSQNVTSVIPVTHTKMRLLEWALHLMYRLKSGVHRWGRGLRLSDHQKRRFEAGKEAVKTGIWERLHLRVDRPDPYGRGGNTNKGPTADTFFSEASRDHLCSLFNDEDGPDMQELLQRLSVILRVVSSSSRTIDSVAFEEYCRSTYLHILTSYPWASITPSLHRVLGHASERISLNGGKGLGDLSEESLEANNKLIRRFRERLARKTSLKDNLHDVFVRLWIRSDPRISSFARSLCCSSCSGEGHTIRSCTLFRHTALTHDDDLVNSFFVNSE